MLSLLLITFLIQLVIQIINTVGVSAINSALWKIWNKFLTPTSEYLAENHKLRIQVLKLREELNSTSSQDEFAKWAKLRRVHDKAVEKLEVSQKLLDSCKSKFDNTINVLRWVSINGLRIVLQFLFQKQPMLYIPKGWIPYHAEWLLAFPRAPLGSISIQAWSFSCVVVLELMSELVMTVFILSNYLRPVPRDKERKDQKNS
ncbi:Protein get1 [Golovinomyces cichoracearum]|uniref:Protein get1 n=1 Tax=Golovinomyces cichoracearum TaxID=62708 RepID=A0A420IJX5_9PEZI|nr:Protein get1 [Golovinomyces cichoracearum]